MLDQLDLALAQPEAVPNSPLLTLRSGRVMYRVRNIRARLSEVREAVRKCPGWSGRHTPKPKPKQDRGVIYWHRGLGFKLLIPPHLAPLDVYRAPDGALQIGQVTLKLTHNNRTISGDVPASWLVDLNTPSPDEGLL